MSDHSIIGIDFGTSSTVIKVKNYHDGMVKAECQSLVIDGSPTVPTQAFLRDDNRYFFGNEVESEIQSGSKGELYRNFKMDLIDPNKRNNAERVTKEFVKYLYREFNKQRQELHVFPDVKTYVSYPAKWPPQVISFMKQCVIDAGFGSSSSVFGETEPMAAIYAALTNNQDKIKEKHLISHEIPINVMMLDMGAGTSDITIFKLIIGRDNKITIGPDGQIISHPTIDNTYLCGGREIDSILAAYNIDYMSRVLPSVPEGTKKTIIESIKRWKEVVVSPSMERNATISAPSSVSNIITQLRQFGIVNESPFPAIDRTVFESMTQNHWSQLHSLISDAINRASEVIKDLNGPQDIDIAIITGGHSQWYIVKELMLGKQVAGCPAINFSKLIACPERIFSQARPQETVANGMVYRDLEFDVTHTASNNLWVQFKLNDQCISNWFNPLSIYETIPCNKYNTISWATTLYRCPSSTDDAELTCICAYGAKQESAVINQIKVSVTLNGLFHLLGGIIDEIFGNGNKVAYKISVKVSVSINEDGSGYIYGILSSDRNDWTSPTFRINL